MQEEELLGFGQPNGACLKDKCIVVKVKVVFFVIWKAQCDWLSLGKECCFPLSRRLWGGKKYELP